MPFDSFSPRLKQVAVSGQKYLTGRFGRNGLKADVEIDASIAWRPTIQLKPSRALIVAAEVSDSLYPSALKIAAHDILKYDFPISVYLICPLEIFMADRGQKITGDLRRHGFGILTADEQGNVSAQGPCIPLAQCLSDDEVDFSGLTPKARVAFRQALEVYKTNEGQGLQQAGQIVEAIVRSLAKAAAHAGIIPQPAPVKALAEVIDELYVTNAFKNHRASLGGARDFVKEYRNIASHPADTPKNAINKIRRCKTGILDALRISKNLLRVMQDKGYRASINVT